MREGNGRLLRHSFAKNDALPATITEYLVIGPYRVPRYAFDVPAHPGSADAGTTRQIYPVPAPKQAVRLRPGSDVAPARHVCAILRCSEVLEANAEEAVGSVSWRRMA